MKPTVFLDLDGVLCDFVGGALKAHGRDLPPAEARWDFMTQVGFASGGDPEFWKPLGNPQFWADLDPHPDGMSLLAVLRSLRTRGRLDLAVLSSGQCPGSADGKRDWLKKHAPDLVPNAIFGVNKAVCASPRHVLIDDYDGNTDAFAAAGGHVVLVPRPWNRNGQKCLKGEATFDSTDVAGEVAGVILAMTRCGGCGNYKL